MKKAKTGKWNDYPDISTTSSFTDTTGMMPTPPLTDEQFEAYQDLAGMEIPKKRKRTNNKIPVMRGFFIAHYLPFPAFAFSNISTSTLPTLSEYSTTRCFWSLGK